MRCNSIISLVAALQEDKGIIAAVDIKPCCISRSVQARIFSPMLSKFMLVCDIELDILTATCRVRISEAQQHFLSENNPIVQ